MILGSVYNILELQWGVALIRGSDFQIIADVDLSRFRIADNLLLRHMTHKDIGDMRVGELPYG